MKIKLAKWNKFNTSDGVGRVEEMRRELISQSILEVKFSTVVHLLKKQCDLKTELTLHI